MAQVMVNFRMDENVKKSMEQACKEMGLSMTTAFTIFATKVGREKRIPFEVTAEPGGEPVRRPRPAGSRKEEPFMHEEKREWFEASCAEIRQSLTAMHTAIPSSATGMVMERIRMLCGGELKERAAEITAGLRNLFLERNAGALEERDHRLLDICLKGLSELAGILRDIEGELVPALRTWPGGDAGCFAMYERQLQAANRDFDQLQYVLRRFLSSGEQRQGSARAVTARIRKAGSLVETAYVRTALENLEALVLRHYDGLDGQAKSRLEGYYLQTLELTLEELAQAEQEDGDTGEKAALCLRAANVLSRVLTGSGQVHRELRRRNLEAEVSALERLAALRGDVEGDTKPET